MRYRFDAFELDSRSRELRRAGSLVGVEPQVFDLLELLIRNRDRVVTKDDMIASVWSGRIVSESTLTSRLNAARSAIGDDGKGQRLIRTMRHRGVRFVGAVSEEHEPADVPPPVRPETPSIVVLPFANLSGDPAQDYFADGMVEDITMALGRLPWLFVIASASAFTYKGRNVDPRQVAAELGVRYLLQGSVRKDRTRIRIGVQLTDASTAQQILSDRFDGAPRDIFSIQDEVATRLSAAIAPKLRSKEIERARRKPTSNLTAYDLFLRALPPRRDNQAQNAESLRLLYQALELDPSFSSAYGLAAWCHEIQAVFGWLPPSNARVNEGLRLAQLATETGDDDPEALWMAGLTIATLAGDAARGAALIDKSLALNPNSARAWWASGVVQTYLGGFDLAFDGFERSRRLNPLDTASYAYWTAIATTHVFAGDYVAAFDTLRKALLDWPDSPPALRLDAAVCGLLGRRDQGRHSIARWLARVPHASIDTARAYFQPITTTQPHVLQALLHGLRESGVAEVAPRYVAKVTSLRQM
ncbi:MAG TPA: winged helix-turn-helix domain-containing tetratricopeptide repeat protein [Xanthobacteraceae bacterium]